MSRSVLVHTNPFGIITPDNPDPTPDPPLSHSGSTAMASAKAIKNSLFSKRSNKYAAAQPVPSHYSYYDEDTQRDDTYSHEQYTSDPYPAPVVGPDDVAGYAQQLEPYEVAEDPSIPTDQVAVPSRVPVSSYYDEEDDGEWHYDPNHSRGAAAMNGYDRNGLKYEYPKGSDVPRWIQILQRALYVAQILMVMGAAIIMAGAYVAERNGWDFAENNGIIFGKMEEELIYVPYAAGIMSCITAFVGCMSARLRSNGARIMLVVYMAMLIPSLCVSIAAMAQGFADKANVFRYAMRQWDQLTEAQEKIFEWEHFCCNFQTLDPCCRFTYGEGECVNEFVCFEKVEPHLVEQFNIIIATSMVHSIYMFAVALVSGGMYLFMVISDKQKLANNTNKNANGRSSMARTTAPGGRAGAVAVPEQEGADDYNNVNVTQ